MKNPYIIPAAMICAAILAGFWILKSPSEQPQKVVIVQPPQPPSISIRDAVFDENIESVKQYLDAGGDVNAEDRNGYTPLQLAAEYGHKEVAELLIAKGAYVNAKDEFGFTPLLHAARKGHKEIAELLIANGADVNAKDDIEWTPLHQAAHGGHKEVVELLNNKGAYVNAKDRAGGTPLHYVEMETKETAELLIAKGANVNAIIQSGSYEGMTPLDFAIKDKHPATAELLRKHGGKKGEELGALIDAAMDGDIEAVKQHLANGADVNAEDRDGDSWTPLHYAAYGDHKEVVELLIAAGAYVNAKDEDGDTPLDFASGEIDDLLRKHGAKGGSRKY